MRVCHQCGAVARPDDRFCAACGATLQTGGSSGTGDPLLGRTIGGSYVLQEIVGVGGMGRVYRAEQSTLGRTVAIKVIHPHLLGDEQTVARFYTEARASSRLNHPNSVSIIDFGRTDDGILFLAMEFLKGKDLALVMHEEGPLAFERICELLAAVLDALGEAHALDIVHRDLKPENIILTPRRSGGDLVKVVDFGLATIVDQASTSITRPGLVCGTPDYMAPEQGRGESVDGRGDLYALAVVLFELLTDRLPFDDETPTKVVLRHIHDPVPDPRLVAPHREIPDALAAVAMRGLQKLQTERYQTAAEMRDALLRAREALTTNQSATIVCSNCNAENPANMRFCGACGSRLGSSVAPLRPGVGSAPPAVGSALPDTVVPRAPDAARNPAKRVSDSPRRVARPSFAPPTGVDRPFVGRLFELERLGGLRRASQGSFHWARVEGEQGVGKTRLLTEVAERFADDGDLVVGAGPHPTGALVPYGPIRQIVADLLELDVAALATVPDHAAFDDPISKAGAEELSAPVGIRGFPGEGRAPAVARALAAALAHAAPRAGTERVVLIVDDLSRCDGLTQDVLASLEPALEEQSVFLVTADVRRRGGVGERLVLEGLSVEEAGLFLARRGGAGGSTGGGTLAQRRLLPLFLEQLGALGMVDLSSDSLPRRLADAVAQRVERVEQRARRVLQAVAVFGGRCASQQLAKALEQGELAGLEELMRDGLVRVEGGLVEVSHPFVAELVEAFIPAEARKQMHARVLELATEAGAPLEVRLEHAYRAGETMRTLVLLERMGDEAYQRGDRVASIQGLRRALELARREMLESGDPLLETAILSFSRKLALALARAGELAGADGVVREVLDLTGPYDVSRAKLYLVLGEVAGLRGRSRDAMRHYGKALEIVAGEDARVEAELQLSLGRARRKDGDPRGAANAYRRCLELHQELPGGGVGAARVAVELAAALFDAGDQEELRERLVDARRRAELDGAPALLAEVAGLAGRLAEREGRTADAIQRYAEASRQAAEAGDLRRHALWRGAAAAPG